ncbi:transcriptional activator protein LuxR [Vibrio ponticus]|nr:transcriptional activator protein LuxR [Vibrio ponticus]
MATDTQTLQRLLDLANQCVQATSTQTDAQNILTQLRELIPYSSALLALDHNSDFSFQTERQMVVKDQPQGWIDHYFKQEYWKVDHILARIQINDGSISWRKNEPHIICPEFAADYQQKLGREGLSILVKNDTGSTIISLSTDNRPLKAEYQPNLDYIAPHIHEVFMRKGEYNRFALGFPQLKARELEVLKWAKEGKSNWEIAQILNLSERTIKFHFTNIFQKLNVVNRSQAVARAVHAKLIEL